ncbi:uncharacterized protein UV8b_00507 [Ustilaginoidea virens]|uniref:Uncharacterized protein n=1 Tax=Ustilaginoidea virens TaxID=1159556 RepID=A0A8E5MEE4_USTVR|nr:uncharacterized protein UV8b_00507 [Ustilaginoidea virens]QUC16266.1 hypothetical protein UV8b_00507 [Ustilaginoidea virens]
MNGDRQRQYQPYVSTVRINRTYQLRLIYQGSALVYQIRGFICSGGQLIRAVP